MWVAMKWYFWNLLWLKEYKSLAQLYIVVPNVIIETQCKEIVDRLYVLCVIK